VTLTGARTLQGGACVRVQGYGGDPWLMVRHGVFHDCHVVDGGGGGAIVVLAGLAVLIDTVVRETSVHSVNSNTRGGAIGVQDGALWARNVHFTNTSVSTVTAQAYGGAVAVWATGDVNMTNVTFDGCSATSVAIRRSRCAVPPSMSHHY
jgi:hypothetical protein